MDLLKFKLTIAYDGTGYEGWQVQKTGTGVQEKVEAALAKLFPSHPRVHSSSRTDTGVHALGMVAHFEVPPAECKMTTRKLALALNAWLPEDIRVLAAARARQDFHARFQATGKQYRYFVWNHAAMNPLLRHTAWHVPRPLDLRAMRAAAPLLCGQARLPVLRRQPGLRESVHRPHADALRTQAARAVADLHHRRGRLPLQDVPRHRGHAGAGGIGQVPGGGSPANAGEEGPACGRHDRAGARTGVVEGVLSQANAHRPA